MPENQKSTDKSAIPDRERTASAMEGLDSADPHPAEEGDPYDTRHPAGPKPPNPSKDIGPNPAKHDGSAQRRPDNVGTGGKP